MAVLPDFPHFMIQTIKRNFITIPFRTVIVFFIFIYEFPNHTFISHYTKERFVLDRFFQLYYNEGGILYEGSVWIYGFR